MEFRFKPKDLDEVVDDLIAFWGKNAQDMKKVSEEDFVVGAHFGGAAAFIRNNYGLWTKDSELYEFFKSKGIVHPDDSSAIITRTLHRRLHGLPEDLEGQIEKYKAFWRTQGFENGIPEI